MSNLVAFTFEANEVRTIDRDGEAWFVAKDVFAVLGKTSKSGDDFKDLDDDERGVFKIHSGGQAREMVIISESGLYSLIMKSRKPIAIPFQKWVTKEILPQIRKHSVYADTEQRLTVCTPEQIHNNLLALATELQRKYPRLNISDENIIWGNKYELAKLYWDDMSKLGLPVINILTQSKLQIEFMWENWEKYGLVKKSAVFEKMKLVCVGLKSYNECRKFAFHGLGENQRDEWVLGFTDIDHAKRIAISMRHGVTEVLR